MRATANPTSKSKATFTRVARSYQEKVMEGPAQNSSSDQLSSSCALIERPLPKATNRRPLPNNFLLKRLDLLYWKRLMRYLYIRFLRMQGSSAAIARGLAAGAFAGSFPLLGFQTLIGIAIAALFRGNKVMAAVGTWISNPLTYVPLMALNFHIGRWLLRLPNDTVLPTSVSGLSAWMELGMSVAAALMVGSALVGLVAAVIAYYLGLTVAHRVRSAKRRK